MHLHGYSTARLDAKGNDVFCSNSKLMRSILWNESKLRGLRQIKNTAGWLAEFSALIAASATVAFPISLFAANRDARSLIIQAKCGTFAGSDCIDAVLFDSRERLRP